MGNHTCEEFVQNSMTQQAVFLLKIKVLTYKEFIKPNHPTYQALFTIYQTFETTHSQSKESVPIQESQKKIDVAILIF